MEEKMPEEIMAECLLKGGKMLAKACSKCGAPLFEYRGETLCVVCNPPDKKDTGSAMGAMVGSQKKEEPVTPPELMNYGGRIAEELTLTLIALCRRIREEEDPRRCSELMSCISTGIEALHRLSSQ